MNNDEAFEPHPGPLKKGDIIVVEIGGKLVSRRPNDPTPQWFVVETDQDGDGPISLSVFSGSKKGLTARKYVANWKW